MLESFFNKVTGLRPAKLLKRDSNTGCFLVNFTKFLRRPSLQNTSGQLLLDYEKFKVSNHKHSVLASLIYWRCLSMTPPRLYSNFQTHIASSLLLFNDYNFK